MICPSCQGRRAPRHYLCPRCWHQLPRAAQRALYRRDTTAGARLLELHRQLAADVPLGEIRITA